MSDKRQKIAAAGLVGTMAAVGYTVVHLSGQAAQPTGDFRNAALAEVRNAQGQVVLSGQFQAVEEEDDDVERKAALKTTGVDGDAVGEAEVEFSNEAPTVQEVEFAVRNVPPRESFTFVIDGTTVATVSSDAEGRAEVELEVRIPRAGATR